MRRLTYVAVLPIVLVAGCVGSNASGSPTVHQSARSSGQTAGHAAKESLHTWPTYGRTKSRTGHTAIGVRGRLRHGWRANLDGAVYGEPLVVGSTLIVATENDSVYGLNARDGKRRWRKHLGTPAPLSSLPCGDIDPLGITGTPAFDAKTGSVFAVAETTGGRHTLWALDARNGHRRWHKSMDVLKSRQRDAEQERSAVLVADGRVITTYGGLAGDCANYVGYVTSTATNGKGRTRHYAVPTSREAGMWSPAGPVIGQNGNVYVASGNGAELQGKWDKSDSVTELTPRTLRRVGVFAPSTWPQDNQDDLDLGSSSPVPVNHRVVIAGKRGTVYLLKPGLGGVGSDIASLDGCQAFGGAAVVGHTVLMPCKGENSIRALKVGKHSLKWSWTASNVYSTPVIAGKRVYAADPGSGDLVILRLSDGKVLRRLSAGSLPHFPSETVDGSRVFVGTLDGVTSFKGS
jgi:outer membrane protein assembly factor BamB